MSAGLVGSVASTGRAGGVRLVEVPPRHIGGGNTRGAAAVWARPLSIWAGEDAGDWPLVDSREVIAIARGRSRACGADCRRRSGVDRSQVRAAVGYARSWAAAWQIGQPQISSP